MNSWRYNLLLHLLLPFVYLRLLWRGRTVPTYKQNIEQRFGGHKNLPQHGIMIHAVSLGETLAAQPLVNALLKNYPHFPVIITNTTDHRILLPTSMLLGAILALLTDIMAQMLTESVVLSMFGGIIGTLFGAGIATTIARFTPIPASVELWSVALGIGTRRLARASRGA